MSQHAVLSVTENDLRGACRRLVNTLLEKGGVDAVFVPARQPFGSQVMQTLITSPDDTEGVDPLAPVVPTSSATLLARITRKGAGGRVAAFLRPCEVRAFLELVKLKQATADDLLLIGMDCHGRYANEDYRNHLGGDQDSTHAFLKAIEEGRGTAREDGIDIVETCGACVTPVADQVDLRLQVIGYPTDASFGLASLTPAGDAMLETLGLPAAAEPAGRDEAVQALLAERRTKKEALRAEYKEKVSEIDGLMDLLAPCVSCYNCRVACPVCYCRECVFVTDTFGHEGEQYMGWARKRGQLRMPTDTLFYHLTRMAHMGTLCVACGQCTSACPEGIPVGQLFSMVGEEVQEVFDYRPGRSPEEEQPLACFTSDELHHVTGQAE